MMMASGWLFDWDRLTIQAKGAMMHPGLNGVWVDVVVVGMIVIAIGLSLRMRRPVSVSRGISLAKLPVLGPLVRMLVSSPAVLLVLKVLVLLLFMLVIYAGLSGTPIPERNLATVLTWTIWWAGLVIVILFVGSAWCAVCPWDTLANLMVRMRLFWRNSRAPGMNLQVPKVFRSIWPALLMFVGLTWLELGVGVTVDPYATALLALLMVVLATMSLALYEGKAFCRYFCPVGRTIGFYSGLSPVAVRPVDPAICEKCTTLECYHGTDRVERCPTHLVVGRISQNTYCTSCGNCTQSCPHANVAWNLRTVAEEVMSDARPHTDEAWFLLGLLSLTSFHGITMLPSWESWVDGLSRSIGESGVLLSFSLLMLLSILVPVLLYGLVVVVTRRLGKCGRHARVFSALALATLPLAFSYHIAHNINHLVREGQGFMSVLLNPLGINAQPLSGQEIHFRHLNPLLSQELLFTMQSLLMLFGFWLAARIVVHRLRTLLPEKATLNLRIIVPMFAYIGIVTLFNLWLLMQPMVMRMAGDFCGQA